MQFTGPLKSHFLRFDFWFHFLIFIFLVGLFLAFGGASSAMQSWIGEPVDLQELHAKANQGDLKSQEILGDIYYSGPALGLQFTDKKVQQNFRRDYKEAFKWYLKAAEQGSSESQEMVGAMYALGLGVAQADIEAAKWVKKAAMSGSCSALFSLAEYYYIGKGLPKNDAVTAVIYERLAELGFGGAQRMIGELYSKGRGVQRNYETAYFWLLLSTEAPIMNTGILELMQNVEGNISKKALAAIRKKVKEWKPKEWPSTGCEKLLPAEIK